MKAADDGRRFSALIGDIYDATLDPGLWPGALKKCAAFVGGWSAALIAKDAARKSGILFFDDGVLDRDYVRLYFEKYVKLDPSSTAHYFADIDEPVSTADFLPLEEMYRTRFYREWAKPQGLVDYLSTALDKSATAAAMFGVFRHERDGVVDMPARQRARLLAPHVRRAVLISRVMETKAAQAETFTELLDGLSAGIFLIDAGGRIMHANTTGHRLLADGIYFRAAGGRLIASDNDAERTLAEVFAAAANDDAAVGTRGISVPLRAHDGDCLIAHALPLTSGIRRETGSVHRATSVLFVNRSEPGVPSLPEVVARTYRLTPAELRVLIAIAEVGGVAEIAETLGVAETTVKTHLAHLFQKTGTRRQAELVRLIAGFASPLRAA